MKALVGAFNQEKALVGAFSVIVKTDCETNGSFYSTILEAAGDHEEPGQELDVVRVVGQVPRLLLTPLLLPHRHRALGVGVRGNLRPDM